MKFISELSWDDILVAQEQTHAIWADGLELEFRLSRLKQLLEWPAEERILWMSGMKDEKGALIASMKRYHFHLRVGGKRVKTMGVGAFYCHPDHRGKNIPTALLDAVLSEEKNAGVEASLLYSAIPISYYQRLGFQPLTSQRWSIQLSESTALATSFTVGAALPSERARELLYRWLPASVLCSDLSLAEFNFFRFLNWTSGDVPVRSGDRVVGFFNCRAREGKMLLEDFAHDPMLSSDELNHFWSAIVRYTKAQKCDQLSGWSGFFSMPHDAVVESRLNTFAMLRPLKDELTWPIHQTVHLTPSDYF